MLSRKSLNAESDISYTARTMFKNLKLFMDRVGHRAFGTMLLAICFSAATVIYTDVWLQNIGEQSNKIVYLRQMMTDMIKVRISITSAESSQRGYLLTNRQDYLVPFNSNIATARAALKDLLIQHQANSNQKYIQEKQLIADMSAAIESKIAEMQLTIDLHNSPKPSDALAIVNRDQGLDAMNKITQISDSYYALMIDAINSEVKNRDNKLKWVRVAIILSIFILIAIVVSIFNSLVKEIIEKDKTKELLNQENKNYEIKLEENRRLLLSLALDNQSDIERERHKLARELHDELGSILTATKMDLSWVIKKTKETAPEINEKLVRTSKYLDQGIQLKRRVVESLHPSMITTLGLWAALKNMAEETAARNNWQLRLTLPDDSLNLNNTIGLIVYRVVQETLNNASKYAKATHVTLEILATHNMIKLEIVDDGVGFDLQALDKTTHGLSGMMHRIQAVGGKIELTSSPDKGVETRVILPI
jgi:signal transduction histidine kinase